MTKKKDDKPEEKGMAVALRSDYTSFQIAPADSNAVVIIPDEDILAMIDDEDFENYEDVREQLPYVTIRQKDLKTDKGRLIQPAGGFQYKDKSSEVVDVDGDNGIVVTMLATRFTRVYWKSLEDDQPTCKSFDAIKGTNPTDTAVNNPSGLCQDCPLAQWTEERPKCGTHMNILVADHSMAAAEASNPLYILNLGRSGLKPVKDFQVMAKKHKFKVAGKLRPLPLHFLQVHISTEYVAEPQEHYIPVFKVIGILPMDTIELMKGQRESMKSIFGRVIEATTLVDETEQPGLGSEVVESDELSDGETPAKLDPANEIPADGENGDLPF